MRPLKYLLIATWLLATAMMGFCRPPELEVYLKYTDQLDLSEEQQLQIHRIAIELRKITILREAQARVAEIELEELLNQERPDLKGVETQLDTVSDLHNQVRLAHLAAQVQMQQALSPEQLDQAKQVQERLDQARTQERERAERESTEMLGEEREALRERIQDLEHQVRLLKAEVDRLREQLEQPEAKDADPM